MGKYLGYALDGLVLNDPVVTGGTFSDVTTESDNFMFDGLTGVYAGLTSYTATVTVANGQTTGKEAAIDIPAYFMPIVMGVHVTTAATNAVNLVDVGDDANTDGYVDGAAIAVDSTGFKGFVCCNGVNSFAGGTTAGVALATPDEVEVVLSADPGATGATMRLTFIGFQMATSDWTA